MSDAYDKEYDAIAIRCKGKWVHYMRLDIAVKREVEAKPLKGGRNE